MVTALLASNATQPTGYHADRPPLIGRAAAHALARTELAKPGYHQGGSFVDDIIRRVVTFLSKLVSQVNTAVPGGWWALAALGALAVIIFGVVLTRVGRVSVAHRARHPGVLGGGVATARDHRERAQELAAAGDWSGAIRESLRAIARGLEERAILPPYAGRTADELAVEAGRALPQYGDRLWSAARLFDEVQYGERPGTQDGYAQLQELDAAVGVARPLPLTPERAARGMV